MQPDERAQGFVIAKTVAALLNAEGGTLYIGVDNGGNITGLDADFRYLCRRPRGEYDVRESLDLYNLYLQRNLRQYLGGQAIQYSYRNWCKDAGCSDWSNHYHLL